MEKESLVQKMGTKQQLNDDFGLRNATLKIFGRRSTQQALTPLTLIGT
jgi:hypothetical protein